VRGSAAPSWPVRSGLGVGVFKSIWLDEVKATLFDLVSEGQVAQVILLINSDPAQFIVAFMDQFTRHFIAYSHVCQFIDPTLAITGEFITFCDGAGVRIVKSNRPEGSFA
jgi:hypothetical protein